VIERLKAEALTTRWYKEGKARGLQWAFAASYEDIAMVADRGLTGASDTENKAAARYLRSSTIGFHAMSGGEFDNLIGLLDGFDTAESVNDRARGFFRGVVDFATEVRKRGVPFWQ